MVWKKLSSYAGKYLDQMQTNPKNQSAYNPLGYYGIIGNLETAALIGTNGSIDWMCLPHLESKSSFAKILDSNRGGSFVIQPRCDSKSTQRYIKNTNVLETHFQCEHGEATLTDFMPPFKKRTKWHKHQTLFRRITGVKGTVSFHLLFEPRFDYARTKPKYSDTDTGVVASAGGEKLYLDIPTKFHVDEHSVKTTFTVSEGEEFWFVMQYNSHTYFSAEARERELHNTVRFWKRWAHSCNESECVFRGQWHNMVVRSGLVLKLLTHGETGAIAAAATTSLPESIGSGRNWDYRFNWIRDSVFTAQALFNLGHKQDAKNLLNWYKKIYKKVQVSDIKIMQGLHGEPV
ncbi:MAG: DUF5911 domain-containing protein, partial [Candidatus Taylorbacteria bacterium]|nr:DUF5911 domain-containing protein [Candidatus Taylorbacteria bacterium]